MSREAYVAFCRCGSLVGAAVDDPRYRIENGKTVASWIRDGLSVRRMGVEDARPLIDHCKCEPDSPPQGDPDQLTLEGAA